MSGDGSSREQLRQELERLRRRVAELEERLEPGQRAGDTLRAREALLTEIAANYPNSYMSIIKGDFTIGFTSGQEFKKQGLDPAQFVGLTLEQVFGDDAPHVMEQYRKVFAGEDASFELFINGQHQHYRATPLRSRDGTIRQILSVVEDITAQKEIEERLRKSEEYHRKLLDNLQVGVVVHAPDTTVISANRAAQEILGIDIEQMRFKKAIDPSWAFLGEDNTILPLEAYPVNIVLKSGAPLKNYKCGITIPETGEVKWVLVSAYPVFNNGELDHVVVTFPEITILKRAEELQKTLAEQEQLATIGSLAGKMAHDMNNVLGVTLSLSDLILYSEELPPKLKADIEAIRDSSERGAEITKNLLFFAREQETKYSLFELNGKIAGILKALYKELSGIQVETHFGKEADELIADAGMIENALLNVLHNAVHAMSKTENPRLSIRTDRSDKKIRIAIKDNGCGIPEEHIHRVFDVSFTMKGSMDNLGAYAKNIKGSGYGLANVKKTMDKHGGSIRLESKAGQGTTATMEFPILDVESDAQAFTQVRVQNSIRGKRVLVVEDEPHFGNILYKLLRQYDHQVNIAHTGQIALDYFLQNSYDAISLDFILPDMNGMDVYREIRKTDRTVPIIFVSGNFEFMQSMIDLKEEDPKVDHLAKPFNNLIFVNKIHQWLE